MSFVAPWTIPVLAAALTIPPLVLLYFLKLKRREQPIPSTLLWKRAVQDLQVNAPFQKLRRNLLLLLQLLILLLAIFALARPVANVQHVPAEHVILLVDQSASMNAVEPDGRTRLEHATQQAQVVLDNMARGSQAMLIAFADRAQVLAPFTSDKNVLRQQIDAIQPTDGLSRMAEALQLAEAYATPQIVRDQPGELTPTPVSAAPVANMILFSDGRIEDAGELVLRHSTLQMVRVGQETDNVGIVAVSARRNYERPEEIELYARLRNFSDEPVEADAIIRTNAQERKIVELSFAPAHADSRTSAGDEQEFAVDGLEFAAGGEVMVELARRDALMADNQVRLIVPPPKQLRVLLVTPGNLFLSRVLDGLPVVHREVSPAEYESGDLDDAKLQGFDVIILDRHSTGRLPPGNYLCFGCVPQTEGVSTDGVVEGEIILDWDSTHSLLRNVNLEYVFAARWLKFVLPEHAVTLARGESSPVIAYLAQKTRRFVLVAFDLYESDWPLKVSFPIFCYNACRFLGAGATTAEGHNLQPGEAIAAQAPPGCDEVTMLRPDGRRDRLELHDSPLVNYSDTWRVGTYRVEPSDGQPPIADRSRWLYAVNLLSENESDVRPNEGLTLGGQPVPSGGQQQRINVPLWPWLLVAALGLLLLEWYVYNRRMYV
jgi:hypothetical protein